MENIKLKNINLTKMNSKSLEFTPKTSKDIKLQLNLPSITSHP